ncbi:hypothetical protein D0A34_10760 [Microcoleus vaginatus PCC 9802]|nr:hypothetical protein D0A34_10760 [Microcoleus vaginatus PCC 9802]
MPIPRWLLPIHNSPLPLPHYQLPITDEPGVEQKSAMAVLRCSHCCSKCYSPESAGRAAKNSIAIKKQL